MSTKLTTSRSPYERLDPFDKETGDLNVVIDTPKGSRNKFEFDHDLGLFKLGGVLPAGAVFPFDFGFVPSTLGATATRLMCWCSWMRQRLRDALCLRD